nr:LytTR family DNA-binding domain-containing protein [Virgibacillus siamensis]
MRNLHVLIAEDEQLAREELEFLLNKEPDVVTYPSAETGEELIQLYVEHEPDVIFLDVQMPGMSGVEAAKRITNLAYLQQPLFIFTTAYDTYAIDAFEVEAVDYLLKPYDESRFLKTMKRIRKLMAQSKDTAGQNMPGKKHQTAKLLVDDGERMVVLAPDSIFYAVPSKRVTEIHTKDGIIESRLTLNELEKKLDSESFFRTHRSYLVNLNYIREITPWFNGTSNITLTDKQQTKIPVSRGARKVLLEVFKT